MNPIALPLILYIVLPLFAFAAAVILRRRQRRERPLPLNDQEELRGELREVHRALPLRPSLLSTASSSALSLVVEARLLSGLPRQALDDVEHELLCRSNGHGGSNDPNGYVAIAKALLYCDLEEEARSALRWAQRLGANEPEFDYLRARLRAPDTEALRLCLRACRREPAYAEALYLCARLALRLGFRAEGTRLLRDIAPLMRHSIDRDPYRRDLLALSRGELPGSARRLLHRIHGRLWARHAQAPGPHAITPA